MTVQDTILLATRNPGKIKELTKMLAPFQLKVVGLEEFPNIEEIEETGTTFSENARLKASYAAAQSGLVAVADDSGLIVDALGGAPGVYSARFSAEPGLAPSTERNNRKLLELLRDVPAAARRARFCSVIAAVAPDGSHVEGLGLWEGLISTAPKGENGFGYDPLFFDPELGLTAAEMNQQEKNLRSHRAKAILALSVLWPEFWARQCRRRS